MRWSLRRASSPRYCSRSDSPIEWRRGDLPRLSISTSRISTCHGPSRRRHFARAGAVDDGNTRQSGRTQLNSMLRTSGLSSSFSYGRSSRCDSGRGDWPPNPGAPGPAGAAGFRSRRSLRRHHEALERAGPAQSGAVSCRFPVATDGVGGLGFKVANCDLSALARPKRPVATLEAAYRNPSRFPRRLVIRPTNHEVRALRSQSVISKPDRHTISSADE